MAIILVSVSDSSIVFCVGPLTRYLGFTFTYLSPGVVLLTNGDVTSPLTGCCCCCQCADDEDEDGAWPAWGGLPARSPTTDILLALSRPEWSLRGTLVVRGTVRGNVGTAPADVGGAPRPPPWLESTPASQLTEIIQFGLQQSSEKCAYTC